MQELLTRTDSARPRHPALVAVLFLLIYVGLDGISYWHPIAPVAITPWNPPPGLSICLLLLFGMRFTWLLLVAALLAEWWVRHLPASLPVLLLASATLAGGYALTAHVLARLLPERRLLTSQQLTQFVTVVALASLLIGCTFVAVFHVAGVLSTAQIGEAVLQFWVGDVIGILVVVPLILSHWQREDRSTWQWPDAVWLAILLSLLWYVFALESTDEFRHFYLLFLPLIALALRRGLSGATVAVALTQVALIVLMRPRDPSAETIRGLQMLLMAYAITGLYLGVVISERRRTQQLLLQQQLALARANRMAAVSELASALAHELNQPLSAIALYVRACQRMVVQASSVADIDAVMNRINAEVQRAGAVVHRLREFFRSGGLTLAAQSINELVANIVAAERPRCQGQAVTLQLDLAANVPDLLVDGIHLQTVIDNLLRNALDALSGRSDGQLRIATRFEQDVVSIVVEDNAGGVAEALRPFLFETLTTSKPEGLGLGLAISRQLIEAHGGQLSYEPLPQGSRFRISLPGPAAV